MLSYSVYVLLVWEVKGLKYNPEALFFGQLLSSDHQIVVRYCLS